MYSITAQSMAYVLALMVLSLAGPASAQSACAKDTSQLIVYHAGSLTDAFTSVEQLFTKRTGVCIVDVAAGSVDAARRVTAGKEPADIYASADDEDIDLLLKPAGFADYTIRFAQGGMVLAYTTDSRNADNIAAPGAFNPPANIPAAVSDLYAQLLQPDVIIGGSHPFLDPSGYRADMIFQLAENKSGVDNLYDQLLSHYVITKSSDVLGEDYDYRFTYEHSALAAYNADTTGTYRYVKLPDAVNLAEPRRDRVYREASVTLPGLYPPYGQDTVRIPATRVEWGVTILRTAANRNNAIKFLRLLFGNEGVALQSESGPESISPPQVSQRDYAQLPRALQPLVAVGQRDR